MEMVLGMNIGLKCKITVAAMMGWIERKVKFKNKTFTGSASLWH